MNCFELNSLDRFIAQMPTEVLTVPMVWPTDLRPRQLLMPRSFHHWQLLCCDMLDTQHLNKIRRETTIQKRSTKEYKRLTFLIFSLHILSVFFPFKRPYYSPILATPLAHPQSNAACAGDADAFQLDVELITAHALHQILRHIRGILSCKTHGDKRGIRMSSGVKCHVVLGVVPDLGSSFASSFNKKTKMKKPLWVKMIVHFELNSIVQSFPRNDRRVWAKPSLLRTMWRLETSWDILI